MYAVIRTGGKQYVVSPGDVLKIEKTEGDANGAVEFTDVLAASSESSPLAKPSAAKGRYLQSITLASTMGPGVKVDPSRTRDIVTEAPAAAAA
jgi:ribosomal protein L21